MLRETNHLLQLEREDIPDSAQKLFERNDQLTLYVNNLNLIVQWYNKINRMALDVEKPLIKDELAEIDKVLLKAENNLNWNSPGLCLHFSTTMHVLYSTQNYIACFYADESMVLQRRGTTSSRRARKCVTSSSARRSARTTWPRSSA